MEKNRSWFSKNLVAIRGVISFFLLIAFIVVFFTGLGLSFAPAGKIAKETGWTFFGVPKFKLEKLHDVSGYTMSGLVVLHLILNYKMFINELKMLFK
jgi:hypothetical protein